ncbi:hypothetical protein PLICRDRAFT_151445 [Plicaturopsis crispa FD-325 SS-3]|nr:hypothetical protein PLICRDRAFT_151445 [Plicaturopsis crispa FD-325 SS-3]
MTPPLPLSDQLEDLQLLRCSLLPGEVLTFLDGDAAWTRLLDVFPDVDSAPPDLHTQAHFEVKLANARIGFEVSYPDIAVKGGDRQEQERWQAVVKAKTQEVEDEPPVQEDTDALHYHALLTSHHLVSPHKRRALQQWAAARALAGFAKLGHPGVIYAQGAQADVEAFVADVKGMQWLALRVRFVEPVQARAGVEAEAGWQEFQKVGEVVEEMRRIGRAEYVLSMGIGSAGS